MSDEQHDRRWHCTEPFGFPHEEQEKSMTNLALIYELVQ